MIDKTTTADMTGLWRVKPNKSLRWPKYVIDPENQRGSKATNLRGASGYVVDLDTEHEKRLCRSQERFLEPVPEGVDAKPVAPATWPKPAMNWMIGEGYLDGSARPRRRAVKQVAENEPLADKPPAVLPGLADRSPKTEPKTRTPRPRKEDKDAVEGEAPAD